VHRPCITILEQVAAGIVPGHVLQKTKEIEMNRLLSALACALVVFAGAAPYARAAADRTVGERVDDAKITASVKTKLAADNLKNLVKVDVDTVDGVVHLQGTVPKAQDKAEAERLARGVTGVRQVNNDLRVEAADTGRTVGERVDDAKITTNVKAKLGADSVKNLVKVDVDTQDGVVRLQGTVPTAADKAEAERLARGVNGVRDVMNDLRVEAPSASPSASPRQ
jgi:hyperosmotically inducible protein